MDRVPKILKAGAKEGKARKKVFNSFYKEMVKIKI